MSSPQIGAGSVTTGPFDFGNNGWENPLTKKPRSGEVVKGYTGQTLVKCKYSHYKHRWQNLDGDEIVVLVWNRFKKKE